MARRRYHLVVGLIGLVAMVLAGCAPAAPAPTAAPPKPAESKPAGPAATAPASAPTQAPAAQAPAPQPTAAAKPTGTPIKIGLVTAMSGVNAALAQDQLRGGQLAVKQINAEGGVLGRPVALLDRDDKLNPQEAAKQAELLATNDKVDALTGCVSGATTLALNEIAKRANVVHLGTCQSNQLNKKPDIGPYTFHLALTPWLNQQIVLPWITQNLGKKVFVLYYDFAWGHENFESIDKWSKVNNIQLAGAIKTPFPTGDFTPLIPQIANAKPDVLLAMVSGSDQAGFLKQAQSFGLPKQMKIVNAVADLAWDKEAGFANIDGHYGGMNFSWELQDKSPTAKAYVEAFAKEFNSPPGGYSAYQYSAIRAYIDAVKKAGSADPAKVAPALEGLSFDYGVGKSFIRKCDHQLFQPVHIGKGRSEAAAKTVKGWPDYAFREFVTSLEPSEQNERTCQELVGG